MKIKNYIKYTNCGDNAHLLAFLNSSISANSSAAFSAPLKFGTRLNIKFGGTAHLL